MRWTLLLCVLGMQMAVAAGEISVKDEESTGWQAYRLRQGDTEVHIVPAAGANAFSVKHRGTEYFRVPEDLADLPGVGYGNPILYPMPNRVRGATFTYDGQSYEFPPNGRGNFIHGLVHSEPFEVVNQHVDSQSASITCQLEFQPETRRYELFPWKHIFRMVIQVRDGAVRWTYEVRNDEPERSLPFGVALHPYFVYQQSRAQTFLQVPATHLMEAENQLPSGNLLDLEGHPLDARQPRSLQGYSADDVFYGMRLERPARVEFRDVGRSVEFVASPEFTHLVVYTPDRPYFCIENQTCSTDAHNLAAQGKQQVAHLQICPAGQARSGFVEYRFKKEE